MFDQDFFWNLFLKTGRVDAYLLLKQHASSDSISSDKTKIEKHQE